MQLQRRVRAPQARPRAVVLRVHVWAIREYMCLSRARITSLESSEGMILHPETSTHTNRPSIRLNRRMVVRHLVVLVPHERPRRAICTVEVRRLAEGADGLLVLFARGVVVAWWWGKSVSQSRQQ